MAKKSSQYLKRQQRGGLRQHDRIIRSPGWTANWRRPGFLIRAAAAYALIAAVLAIIGAAVVPPAEHGFVPIHECAELVIEERGGCTNVFGR